MDGDSEPVTARITDQDVLEFQELYKKHFGKDLSREDARKQATDLVIMVGRTYKPISVEQYQEFRQYRLAKGENKPTGKKWVLRFREVDRDGFNDIEEGRKTVETRAATPKYRKISMGDTLVITCGKDKVEKLVNYTWIFADIADMVKAIDLKAIMPRVSSVDEAKKVYNGFTGYKEKIKQHGLMAFELE